MYAQGRTDRQRVTRAEQRLQLSSRDTRPDACERHVWMERPLLARDAE